MASRLSNCPGIIAAAFCWLPCTTAMAASPPIVEAQGKLESVLVRSNGATMERILTAKVPAGVSRIVLHGLPLSSQSSGMQVSGTAVGALSIGSANLRKTNVGMLPESVAYRAALEAELQELQGKAARLDVVLAGAKATRDAVTALLTHPGDGGDPRALVALSRDAMSEAAESMRVIDITSRPITARIRAIEEEIAALSIKASAQSIDLVVDVDSEREGNVRLNVRHDIVEVSWSNAYEARLNTQKHSMELVQIALVRQSTGEDWNDVHLVLSSGRSVSTSSPPMSYGQLLSLQPPAPPPTPNPVPALASRVIGNSLPAAAPIVVVNELKTASVAEAGVDVRGLAVEYSISGKVSVPSYSLSITKGIVPVPAQQEFERFRVADLSVHDASIRTVAVPSQNKTAWLQAEFHSPGGAPLPSGPVMLDVDGARVGEGNLAAMLPGEIVVLGFGADPGVKIGYEPQEARRSSEFSIGGRRSISTRVGLITVKNTHPEPWDIRILEPVPVSVEEGITVETVMDPAPGNTKFSDTPGLYVWNLTIPANDERRIKSGWTVTSPDGKLIMSRTSPFSLEKH